MTNIPVRRITWRTADFARVLSLGLVVFFAWTFFWRVYPALFLALIAVLLAMVIHAPARLLSRWMPFRVAFGLTLILLFAVAAAFLVSVIPQIIEQVSQLAAQLPGALDSVRAWVQERTGTVGNDRMTEQLGRQLGDFVGRFVPLAFNVITVVFGSFAVLVLAIFLAAQPDVYRDLFLRVMPPAQRERWAEVYDEAGRSLRNWVIGKVFTMTMVGLLTWIGLVAFDVPGALALAALAAMLEFVPNLGPTIAAAPAVIAAFSVSPATALYVTLYYVVLQQVQSALTVPLIERRAVDIPPAALLAWQLMLAVGFGILALFVATPLLALIVVAVRILYLEPSEDRQAHDRRESAEAAIVLRTGDTV